MRSHLIRCLQKKNAISLSTLFFFQIRKKKTKKKQQQKTKTKEYIYCKCRGQYDSEMVQWVTCVAWLHHRYINQHIVKQIEGNKNFVFKCY